MTEFFWTDAEQDWLRVNGPDLTAKQCGAHLGRSAHEVRKKAARIGVCLVLERPSPAPRGWWTEDRLTLLRKLWSEGLTAAQIADELGEVSRNAVLGKAHRLGLPQRGKVAAQTASKVHARASRARQDRDARPVREYRAPAYRRLPPEPVRVPISARDNDLIARFMAERAITECPTRWADGSIHPSYPGKSWRAV